MFTTSVNSPLKPPPQNANKEATPTPGINGRKSSISQVQSGSGPYGTALQSARPGPRRRETGESISSPSALASPTSFNRTPRDDGPLATPPSSLLRRRTEVKDALGFGDKQRVESGLEMGSPFGSLKRTVTGPMSAGITGPSSPWSSTAPQSAGFGAFGSFSLEGSSGQPSTPGERKMGFGSLRGESRFKGLMSKKSSDDISSRSKEKGFSSLDKSAESDTQRQGTKWGQERLAQPTSGDLDVSVDLEQRIGSAVLGGDEPSPPAQSFLSKVDEQRTHDEIGFSSLGSVTETGQRRAIPSQNTPHINRYSNSQSHEPMSPTDTNPYQSPEAGRVASAGEPEEETIQDLYGVRGNPPKPIESAYDGADRSQTSSAGPARGFTTLGNVGNLGAINNTGGWTTSPNTIGNVNRTTPGYSSSFGDSIFGPTNDIQSPGGNVFGAPGTGYSSIGRSKMGSLFPSQMQEQMRVGDSLRNDYSFPDISLGRGPNASEFNPPLRDAESPLQTGRGVLDDLFGSLENRGRNVADVTSPFSTTNVPQNVFSQGQPQSSAQALYSASSSFAPTPSVAAPSNNGSLFGRSPEPESTSGSVQNQLPTAQQRQMVMPDRMRWIYRDPQGQTQGPWSGLEMHEWYKQGFFSPELQVKKVEDTDYEPLAQLIRRIGNSREPFLVPQIGIPHGEASARPIGSGSSLGALSSGGVQGGTAQPPFAGSFPSFGTTLTAEQQNALERRKQEEQYLMARQKEHLAQHQVILKQKQMQMQGIAHSVHPQQLHHHSSAHSLQSQPSYGSITSPSAYQPTPGQLPVQQSGAMQGFFDSQLRPGMPGSGFPGESFHVGLDADLNATMERLNLNRGIQSPYGSMPSQVQQEGLTHPQQVATMLQDRARLQREQEQYDAMQRGSTADGPEGLERIEQYQLLRAVEGEQASGMASGVIGKQIARGNLDEGPSSYQKSNEPLQKPGSPSISADTSLIDKEQVTEQTVVPPAPSISPLPAPAAQRNRQYIADSLNAESRSRSQTPSIDTPTTTLAPWAKDNQEGPKGPSLKEIQEAEARKTAQQEEIAAAARRALAEQERLSSAQMVALTPGLPSSANWAASASPVTPTAGISAWAKPLAGKVATQTTTTKKTLAQIQKEEEARKSRAAAAAAVVSTSSTALPANIPGGKRYADLASKVASSTPTNAGGAWTTVGASGKTKAPASPVVLSSTAPRASLQSTITAGPKPKSTTSARSNVAGSSNQNANDEFLKWARLVLGKGLNAGIDGTVDAKLFQLHGY